MANSNNSQPVLITMYILVFNLYTNSFRDRWKFVSNVDLFIPLRILCFILHLCFFLIINYETNNKQIILLKMQYSHMIILRIPLSFALYHLLIQFIIIQIQFLVNSQILVPKYLTPSARNPEQINLQYLVNNSIISAHHCITKMYCDGKIQCFLGRISCSKCTEEPYISTQPYRVPVRIINLRFFQQKTQQQMDQHLSSPLSVAIE